MAKLTDLPVELLLMIAESGDSGSTEFYGFTILEESDLVSLVFTCRRFYEVFNRMLYMKDVKHSYYNFFYSAVRKGNLASLKVADSFQIGLPHMKWGSPSYLLQLACGNGYLDITEWLLDHGAPFNELLPCEGMNENSPKGCAALWNALQRSQEDTALLMLSRGSNPIYTTEQNTSRSALHYAACFNMVRVVEYLVKERGLSINLKDMKGYTPLRYTMRYTKTPDTDTTMIKKLIELGADVNTEKFGELPLTSALMRGKYRNVEILLDAGSKVKPDQPVRKVKYPIHGFIYGTKAAISKPKISAQKAILQRLIDAGVDLTEKYPQGYSPLQEAILNGSPETMSQLLLILTEKYKGATDVTDHLGFLLQNTNGIKSFHAKLMNLLEHGAKIDAPLHDGRTLLQWAVDNYSRYFQPKYLYDVLDMATESMLDWKYLNKLLTELATSSKYDNTNSIEYMIDALICHGATIEDPDDIYSAAKASLRRPCPDYCVLDSFTLIFDSGIPAEKLPGLLTEALEYQSPVWVRYLLGRLEPDFDPANRDPNWLHQAAAWDDVDVIKRLLEGISSADVNRLNAEGMTPLAIATRYSLNRPPYSTIVAFLEHGADPFLPKGPLMCTGKDAAESTWCFEEVSAFEVAVHCDMGHAAREMWERTAPQARPSPKTFTQCMEKHLFGGDAKWETWFDTGNMEEYYSCWVALLEQIEAEGDEANRNEEGVQEV
ncbi:ankyrin [Daldinia grandis]|nr:ankyrin [Daldinia grandis]